MGAEREDTDPRRAGTEPGLGKKPASATVESGLTPAATVSEDHGPVDFDALHAALGDPLDFEELPPAATEIGAPGHGGESDDLLDGLDPAREKPERVGESSGRSSATYASARPHTIPPSYSPSEDLNAPPVIVASEDTVPSAPPQMTVRVAGPGHLVGQTPRSGVPFVAGPAAGDHGAPGAAGAHLATGPHQPGHPSSGPHLNAAPVSPSYPHTPQAFPIQQQPHQRGVAQMTMRMPERPLNPRRAKTPTLVVRVRGPSPKQKLVAFMAMLLLFVACGIAVIIWRKPRWLGLDPILPLPAPTASTSGATGSLAPSASAAITASSTASAAASGADASASAAMASASSSASAALKLNKPARPAAPPSTPPPTAHPSGSASTRM